MPGRPLAAQCGKAGRQAHQCYRDANPGNHIDKKLFHTSSELTKKSRHERKCKTFIDIYLDAHLFVGISRAENCCVSILVPHNIYLKECNHTKQSEHLTENTKFNFMAEKIFCYMYHSLFYSHKYKLSPTLHLIFKQHFRENSRGELQLCNHKWAPWRAGGIDKFLVGEDGTGFFFYSTLKSVSCSSQNLTFKILV